MVLTLALSAACLSALVSFAIIKTTNHGLTAGTDETLEADFAGFMDLYEQRRVIGMREGMERRQGIVSPSSQIFILLHKDGSKLAGNIQDWPENLVEDTNWQTFFLTDEAGLTTRYRGGVKILRGGFRFLNARSVEPNDKLVASLKKTAVLATLAISFLSVIFGVIFVRRILSQIDAVNRVASRVEDGFLEDRVTLSGSQNEFQKLGSNINSMLDKIGSHQKRMNAMSEHIAHELKTPLNRIRKSVHAVQKQNAESPTEIQDAIERIDNEVSETIRTFDAVLEIVTTQQSLADKTNFQPVDTCVVIEELLTLYGPLADEKQLAIQNVCMPDLTVFGDHTLLMQMFSNVIDNAVKFTETNGEIIVRSARQNDRIIINFANDGSCLREDEKDTIFSQFQRAGNAGNTHGFGLGLALVKAIATRHNFDVYLPENASGFQIEFSCPAMFGSERA